jgi:outer membrane receptor protein involved in Fe transport
MLSYKHTFPRSGEELTADLNYSKGTNTNNNLVNSDIYDVKGDPNSLHYFNQKQVGSGSNEYTTGQVDFTNPITEKSKFETGARIAARNISSLNDIYYQIPPDKGYILQPPLSSVYNYQDRVYAAYATYSNAIKDFGFNVGLRGESSNYKGNDKTEVKTPSGGLMDSIGYYSNKFPISLFPSVFLSQKLKSDQDLSLNYTRRIDRPSFFQLFPFTDYSDSLNLSKGNPNLKPQFTNSFELSYQKTFKGNNTLLASVYYKYTTDLITRYQNKEKNPLTDSLVYINTYINANSSYVGGLELIGRNTITNWWDITSNINIFTSRINTSDSIETAKQTYSWFGKINNTFKLPKNFSLQLTGDYTSKTVLPPGGSASNGGGGRGWQGTVSGNSQGYTKPSGGVDAALKYEFLKNRTASLTLSVSDIFRTRVSDVYTTTDGFTQDAFRRRDPQFFRLQFNWRFGKFDTALFKRKNIKGEMESIQGGMQGGQGPGGGGGPQN